MTEAEWLACGDPCEMIRGAPQAAIPRRKWLLFASASARRAWGMVTVESSASPEHLERLAEQPEGPDDRATDAVCGAALAIARALDFLDGGRHSERFERGIRRNVPRALRDLVYISCTANTAARARGGREGQAMLTKEMRLQSDLLRDILGDPYRPTRVEAQWLARNDGMARLVAEAIEAERDYGRVCVLGDALQDSGCEDEAILAHCRGSPHARGCWVVDLILGKQ